MRGESSPSAHGMCHECGPSLHHKAHEKSFGVVVVVCGCMYTKLLHHAKVGIADANDDDGEGHARRRHDCVDGLVHVCDGAVCQNQQNQVLLLPAAADALGGVVGLADD